MTFIAKTCHVSITTVTRVLMVDEFRYHASYEDKMRFICPDGESEDLVDILPSRKLEKLIPYFNRSPLKEREKVKFLVTDMNAAFNEFRVREMKGLVKQNKRSEANKLKSNWKFLLKNQMNVSVSEFKLRRSFPSPKFPLLTESMMIDRVFSFSSDLKEAYTIFQLLTCHFKNKDSHSFFELLRNLSNSLDSQFKEKLENLLAYKDGIHNALQYEFSNGKIEEKNTHIKTLKRVSYGFKSFTNMRTRIFLINGLVTFR